MDAMHWELIEALREADEAAEDLTEADMTPVVIVDDEGGAIEVYPDGSYVAKWHGEIA